MRVTLYVPCYNGARWLPACLEAIAAQTFPPDEVLVIDDGSTDDSAGIAAEAGARVIWHETNCGLAAARNTALAHATGDFIAAVDADVVPDPDWLARLLDCFDTPQIAAAGGMLIERYTQRAPDRWRAAHMGQHWGTTRAVNPPSLAGANSVFRTAALRALGGYNERYRTNYEDCDIYQRLRARGYDAIYEPAAVAYHLRSDSVTTVLTTYENWLRPPYETRGDYDRDTGLRRKLLDTVHQLRAALAQDQQAGDRPLAYLTLLAWLRTPVADLRFARQRAATAGFLGLAAATPSAAAAFRSQLLSAVAARHAQLPPLLRVHLDAVLVPSQTERATVRHAIASSELPDPLPEVLEAATLALDELDYYTWRELPAAAQAIGAEWLPESGEALPAVGQFRLPTTTVDGQPDDPLLPSVRPPPGVRQWAQRRSADLAAVVICGADEPALRRPATDLLAITRAAAPPRQAARWQAEVAPAARYLAGTGTPTLRHVPVHALGWLPPSAGLLDLRTRGQVIAGDPALLSLVPPVQPSELPRAEGLWRAAVAAVRLLSIWPDPTAKEHVLDLEVFTCARAISMASDAVLLARGAYRAQPTARRAALREEHDGQPDFGAALATTAVASAALDTGTAVTGYMRVAREVILDAARFCATWAMSWERSVETIAALCRLWCAWAGGPVSVPAAALALLAAAPPMAPEPAALVQAAAILDMQDQPQLVWAELRQLWAARLAAAEADGWPLEWQPAPVPGGRP